MGNGATPNRSIPEALVDELTGDQVILAPARALRPDTFRVSADPLPPTDATCPFCPGNEHETPPEVARIGSGAPDGPGWRVRVVPNKFPIAPGAHEVVILSPAHNRDFGALDDAAAAQALCALRDRAAFHLARGAAHVQAFVNHGQAAGASIEHPHAQLVALDIVPPRVQTRVDRFTDTALASDREHLVVDGPVAAWCPRAPTTPFALRCALVDARARFDQANDDELRRVALVLRDTIARLQRLLGAPAYNIVIESAPRDHTKPFSWWVDLVPRITVMAGFELGTGVWINIVAPEDAAAALRETQ